MHEDMHFLLNAYLDGELHDIRLQQMQTHLTSCETCQNELKELRRISELLHTAPVLETRRVDQFITNLTLILPRRSMSVRPAKPGFLLWWLVPAGLLFTWFFVRTTIFVADVVSVAGTFGLLGQANIWLGSGGHQPIWFALLNWISGGQAASSAAFNLLSTLNGIMAGFFSGFLWQVGVGSIYLGWLTVWWVKRRPQTMNNTAHQAQS